MRTLTAALVWVVLSLPEALTAQGARQGGISILAGPTSYDLVGTGNGFNAALRLDGEVLRFLVLETGASYFRYRPGPSTISYVMPEIGVQLQVPKGAVRPYLGGGLGGAAELKGPSRLLLTLHAAAGLRARISEGWGVRGDVRLRSVDPFSGSTLDFGFGIIRRVGR